MFHSTVTWEYRNIGKLSSKMCYETDEFALALCWALVRDRRETISYFKSASGQCVARDLQVVEN